MTAAAFGRTARSSLSCRCFIGVHNVSRLRAGKSVGMRSVCCAHAPYLDTLLSCLRRSGGWRRNGLKKNIGGRDARQLSAIFLYHLRRHVKALAIGAARGRDEAARAVEAGMTFSGRIAMSACALPGQASHAAGVLLMRSNNFIHRCACERAV